MNRNGKKTINERPKDILKFHTLELTNFDKYCRVIHLRNKISTTCTINPRIIANYVTKVFCNLRKSKSISHFKIIKNKFDLHQQNNCKNNKY